MNSELHNPHKLTPEQYGAADGWRLLDADELSSYPVVTTDAIHGWNKVEFVYGDFWAVNHEITYRTKLTRAELRAARGIPEQSTENGAELLMRHLLATGQATTKHPEQPVSNTLVSSPMTPWEKSAASDALMAEFEPVHAPMACETFALMKQPVEAQCAATANAREQLAAAQRENAELREQSNARGRLLESEINANSEWAKIAKQLNARAEAAEAAVTKLREALDRIEQYPEVGAHWHHVITAIKDIASAALTHPEPKPEDGKPTQ